jgi:hypothetical protein
MNPGRYHFCRHGTALYALIQLHAELGDKIKDNARQPATRIKRNEGQHR